MKISELIYELNRVLANHGDIDVSVCDSETGNPQTIEGITLVYPLDRQGIYDRTKLPYSVMVIEWK